MRSRRMIPQAVVDVLRAAADELDDIGNGDYPDHIYGDLSEPDRIQYGSACRAAYAQTVALRAARSLRIALREIEG